MKRHRSFEFLVSKYLQNKGYKTEVTRGVADWGVDVFAQKNGVRYVVQAKLYGDCKTKINRRQMMELFGVQHYFDCRGAILFYNGGIMPDACLVAAKLGIQLIYLDQHELEHIMPNNTNDMTNAFDIIWSNICELEGKVIYKTPDIYYTIETVTGGDITYTNKNGKRHRESADLFRRIIDRIFCYGHIEQSQLRGEFGTYASAFITTILGYTSLIKVTNNPYTIWTNTSNKNDD